MEYGIYRDLIMILANSIFYLLKGDYRAWGFRAPGRCQNKWLRVKGSELGGGYIGQFGGLAYQTEFYCTILILGVKGKRTKRHTFKLLH